MKASLSMLTLCLLPLMVAGASFPPRPEGIKTIESRNFPGVSISFKETTICETTKGVKGYSGYINLPRDASKNRNYESHMYFWFFEARKNPNNAPLAMWLQGGPGVPSSSAPLNENGPCHVLEDSKTTKLNPWSWNNNVNMLYIDQPVQTGYSYDSLVNGTLDVVASPFAYRPANFESGVPQTNLTFLTGTFSSQKLANAPNTTLSSAPFIWDFMQVWMQEFSGYKSSKNRFSLWGESYDGFYGSVFADYFERQSDRLSGSEQEIRLETVGFINPCIDINTQFRYYPEFAYNNTYSIQTITKDKYEAALAAWPTCQSMVSKCKQLAKEKDPASIGNQPDVNSACKSAFDYCFKNLHDDYLKSGRNKFDVTVSAVAEAFPPKYAAGYLNEASTQAALGVSLNWTGQSIPAALGFDQTGDFIVADPLPKLKSLLDRGVKVALLFGDRDYQCNWLGGEAVSLALSSSNSSTFREAGYARIQTNASYVGGFVRQQGNLSFSRIFQAGHAAPFYQPETFYQIFNRVMSNRDVAQGLIPVTPKYSSVGRSSAWTLSDLPPEQAPAKCYLWDVLETCTQAEAAVLRSGQAIVKDFILVGSTNGTKLL